MKFFSLIYQGDVHPTTDKKTIPSSEYTTLLSAIEIVEKARQDVAELFKNTEKECEALRQTAREEGEQKGLEKFNEHIFYLDNELKALRHNLQQMVLPIALKAAKRIVAKELEAHPETIVDIVMQAIAPITESRKVTIYVNREDKEYLDAEKPKLKEILQQAEVLTIQEKPEVERGGCIVQTEGGMINATIQNQWRALERAFEKYQQSE
ncbi:MAG: HrpE/YscL family type III secretion apparatus protein [Verrucomicrobia bacterium]|nr:HrpE/YscL family type III secretion apparatus protein [Verrucomicrobiota bacterium]